MDDLLGKMVAFFLNIFWGNRFIGRLVSYSQLLQCEGVKFIYEEARNQRPLQHGS